MLSGGESTVDRVEGFVRKEGVREQLILDASIISAEPFQSSNFDAEP